MELECSNPFHNCQHEKDVRTYKIIENWSGNSEWNHWPIWNGHPLGASSPSMMPFFNGQGILSQADFQPGRCVRDTRPTCDSGIRSSHAISSHAITNDGSLSLFGLMEQSAAKLSDFVLGFSAGHLSNYLQINAQVAVSHVEFHDRWKRKRWIPNLSGAISSFVSGAPSQLCFAESRLDSFSSISEASWISSGV